MRLATKQLDSGWIVWAYPYNRTEYEEFLGWCSRSFKHTKGNVYLTRDPESLQEFTLKITGKNLTDRTAIYLTWSDHTPAPVKPLLKYKGGTTKSKKR